ncbi:MAG: hypothetical protein KAS32_16530 [Candidatus Peribacteraceae bacterium]|nr:hypothetical protein [Candidatus Peribacteraceae bacterium]
MKKFKQYIEITVFLVFVVGATITAMNTFVTKEAFAGFQDEVRCDRLEDKADNIQDWILDLHIKYDGDITMCTATEKAAHTGKQMRLDRLKGKLEGCDK